MNKFYSPKLTIAFINVFICFALHAQNFHLVKDMNTFTDANPSNFQQPNNSLYAAQAQVYAVLNNTAYFAANDGINGVGLWKSDGTTAGTSLVKPLISGSAVVTDVQNITAFNNSVVFSITTPTINQLWVSDGTNAGTKMISDLKQANVLYAPSGFTVIGSQLYFICSTNLISDQLWRTDGTNTGTVLAADLYNSANSYGYNITNLTSYEGNAVFSVENQNGTGVWEVNSSTYNITQILQNNFPFVSQPTMLTVLNDSLYFIAYNLQGVSLYKSDGTKTGTKIIGSNSELLGLVAIQSFPIINSALYFANANAVYKYDTKNVAAGIQLVDSMFNSSPNYGITNLISAGDSLLFFTLVDTLGQQQLWRSNGTTEHTTVVDTFSSAVNFYGVNNMLYFSNYSSTTGIEIWSSDGSAAGTKLIKDISPGVYSSNPSYFTAMGNNILFTANDGTTGYELWKTDGTESGTALVKDINKTTTADANPQLVSAPPGLQVINTNQILLTASDDLYGSRLWKTDGSANGTYALSNATQSGLQGEINGSLMANFKSKTYYLADGVGDSIALWQTDGTIAGTSIVQYFTDSALGNSPQPINIAASNNLLVIQIRDNSTGEDELWVSNGTFPAKLLSKYSLSFGAGFSTLPLVYFVGNTILFGTRVVAYESGLELWKSDGTVAGTQMVKGIAPATQWSYFTGIVYNDKLYFAANDGTGTHLWISDGTGAGTYSIKNIEINTYVPFTTSNGKLYFTTSDTTHGNELWVTDGTAAGTEMVKDIYPGSGSSNISSLIVVDSTLFFAADDGVHGSELWKSNGTDTGTVLVKDITAGATGSILTYLVNGNSELYFINNGQLWQSNGSDSGTIAAVDANLASVTNIVSLVAAGDKLYFSGYTYAYGQELYVGEANTTLPITLLSFTGQWVKKDAKLTWVTTNELNNNHFNVQRSLTGTGFTTIGSVNATGDATTRNTYNYTDANAASLGSNYVYYRLQQVDNDSKFVYTNIIRLDVAATNVIAIAPNPAQKTANIISGNDILGAQITMTDMGGHVVYTTTQNLAAGTSTPLNISGLAAGVYNVTVQSSNNIKQQIKLVVVR